MGLAPAVAADQLICWTLVSGLLSFDAPPWLTSCRLLTADGGPDPVPGTMRPGPDPAIVALASTTAASSGIAAAAHRMNLARPGTAERVVTSGPRWESESVVAPSVARTSVRELSKY